jgi:hypothetical protein
VISVAWTYTGLNPEDIEARLSQVEASSVCTMV